MKRCLNVLLLALVMAVAMMGVSFAQEDDDSKGQNAEKVKLYKDHIYWIDKDTEKIYVSELGDGEMHVFAKVPDCDDKMLIDGGFIYYYSYDKDAIVKLSIVGKNETVLEMDGDHLRDFGIWNGKLYFVQDIYSPEKKDDEIYICSMELDGGNIKHITIVDCWEMNIYDGKLYFEKREDCGGIYSCDLSSGDIVKISEKCGEKIHVKEDKIYFINDSTLSVMNLDGSGCEFVSKGCYGDVKLYGGIIYSIDEREIQRCASDFYDPVYEGSENEIVGAVFKEKKIYAISAKDVYESDVLNPESNELVKMNCDMDSAYIKDGKMYYQNSATLKCYDISRKTERVLDVDVDNIFAVKDGYIYYSSEYKKKVTGKRAKLETGEIEDLGDMGEDPGDSVISGNGFYYVEWSYENNCNRLAFINLNVPEKKKAYLDLKTDFISNPVESEDYIFYYTSDGIYRVDTKTNGTSKIEGMDSIIAIDGDRIYTYDAYNDSICSNDLDGKRLEGEITGISSRPYFNGRYFVNYDKGNSKLMIVDTESDSRSEMNIELEYFDVVKTQGNDFLYFSGGGPELLALDIGNLSVSRISSGDVYWMGLSDGEAAVISRHKRMSLVEPRDISLKNQK